MSFDIDAIKAREAAATPGPWSWRGRRDEDPYLAGARTRVVMSVLRRERQPDDSETKSYEDYVRDWETPDVDAAGNAVYRRLTDDEVAEHVKKDWLEDPWGGPQYDNRLAFRDHGTNLMEYAREIPIAEHPDAEFIRRAREDVPALVAEIERLRSCIAEYEAAITWDTSCLNCSSLMDTNYAQYCELERAQPVLDALGPWRQQFRPASYMSPPAEVLAAAYDAFMAGPGGCAGHTRKPSEVELPKLTVLSCPCGFTVHATGDVELNAEPDCPIHGEGAGHTKAVAEPTRHVDPGGDDCPRCQEIYAINAAAEGLSSSDTTAPGGAS